MPLIPRIRRGPRGPKLPAAVQDRAPRIERVELPAVEDGERGLRWLNIERPGQVEMRALAEEFDFHELDYEDVLSRRQRPKVDEYAEYLFVVLHFPRYDKSAGRLGTAELDIFIGPDFLITCPNQPLRALGRVFHRSENDAEFRAELFAKGPGFVLYTVLSELFDYCFPILDKIGHKLDEIEDGIFEGRAKEMVRQISNAKQEIIAYRKIIGPELATLRVLEAKTASRFLPGSLEVYFDDVIDAGQRVWDILENYKEVVEALESTNETVVQHGLNDTLLVLTVLNAAVLPMTFVTGLYGMNVDLPFQDNRHAFTIILGIIGLVVATFVLAFRRWRRF
ncbi:MAG: Cobalt/magnesium transport protein CorA [Thermoleophilia bacterium]|nr:Cobalt/magnesium transport protein CorA [Thermoleophilia bacterium]